MGKIQLTEGQYERLKKNLINNTFVTLTKDSVAGSSGEPIRLRSWQEKLLEETLALDALLMIDKEWQETIAKAHAKGILDYAIEIVS